MSREAAAVVVIAVIVVALVLMVLGWYLRRRRQTGLRGVLSVPPETGDAVYGTDLFYVATTRTGQPLDRIAVGGLGFRARAGLDVTSTGIVLRIAGAPERWIPASGIRGVGRATWTIDRVVETDGLVMLGWTLADAEVDSYFRTDEPDALITAVRSILPAVTDTTETVPPAELPKGAE